MNSKTITPAIVSEIAEAPDLLRPMIEDDPRAVMESSLPPLPVMGEQAEDNPLTRSSGAPISEDPQQRRRSNSSARRRKNRHQDVTLLRQDQIETMRLKVISVTDGDQVVEDEIKAG